MNILKTCQALCKVTHKLFWNSTQNSSNNCTQSISRTSTAQSSRPLHPKLNIKFNSPFHFVTADICTYFCILFHAILLTCCRCRRRHSVMHIAELSWKKVAKFNLAPHWAYNFSSEKKRAQGKHSVFLALQDTSWENHLVFISQGSLG